VRATAITPRNVREGQTIWKTSRTLKVSSSAVAKNIKRYDETDSHLMRTATGQEDSELTLLQRISSLELPTSEIAAQIIASQEAGDCKSGLRGRIAAKKSLLKSFSLSPNLRYLVPTAVSLWLRE
jgi:hypothetical protein